MKRVLVPFVLIAALAVAAAGAAVAAGHRAKLKLHNTSVGKILVDGAGFTVYTFSKDTKNHDNCATINNCLMIWPPLQSASKAKAGPGVKGNLIGTITLASGIKQVTYNGHPLYTYIGDSGPHQTFYVGAFQSGGHWYALNAKGHKVK